MSGEVEEDETKPREWPSLIACARDQRELESSAELACRPCVTDEGGAGGMTPLRVRPLLKAVQRGGVDTPRGDHFDICKCGLGGLGVRGCPSRPCERSDQGRETGRVRRKGRMWAVGNCVVVFVLVEKD